MQSAASMCGVQACVKPAHERLTSGLRACMYSEQCSVNGREASDMRKITGTRVHDALPGDGSNLLLNIGSMRRHT